MLEANGKMVNIIDAKLLRLSIDDVISQLKRNTPSVIGLTAVTSEINEVNSVAREIKHIFPSIVTIIGGCHVSALPVETMEHYPSFDIAVIGEGEYTLLEIINNLERSESIRDCKGIVLRDGDVVVANPPRDLITNIDDIPNPAWHLFPPSPYYMIVSSRGCPFSCCFCYRVYGKKLRLRTPQRVIDEIKSIIEFSGAKSIGIVDATFGANRDHSEELMDLLIESGVNKKIDWSTETRVDIGDYAFFAKMKRAGCNSVGFGVESGDEGVLHTTGKNTTIAKIETSVRNAHKAGLQTVGYYILGHPNETKVTAQKTIDLSVKLNTHIATYGIMTPYPGTKVFELATQGKGGYKLISNDYNTYQKHFGKALEFDNVSMGYLNKLRIQGYIRLYMENGRFLDFFKFLVNHNKEAFRLVKYTLSTLFGKKCVGED
uniref:Putative radical SAM superfamily protein n=1 Tax=viral metagenome TaxID=1070528 RepID=A0A6M3KUN9_9ZZZZ